MNCTPTSVYFAWEKTRGSGSMRRGGGVSLPAGNRKPDPPVRFSPLPNIVLR